MRRRSTFFLVPLIFLGLGLSWGDPVPGAEESEVDWQACPADFPAAGYLCTTFEVDEDRSGAGERRIPIFAARSLASPAATKPPLVLLSGGPGLAATAQAPMIAQMFASARPQRDVLLIDIRGSGRSNGLSCPPPGPPDRLQSYLVDLWPASHGETCWKELSRRADLRHYTIPNAMADLEEIRQRLGYPELTLVAISYGTRMAQEYMRRHPDRVESALFFGALPFSVHTPQGFARLADTALREALQECRRDPQCLESYGDLEAKLARLLERTADAPITTTLPNPGTGGLEEVRLHRGMLGSTLRALLYETDFRRLIPRAIHEAAAGRAQLLSMVAAQWQRFFYARIHHGLYYSITCTEDVPFVDLDAELESSAGTVVGDYRVRQQLSACESWPRGEVPSDYFEPVVFDGPGLLVSGAVDPVTPPEIAQQVAAGFSRHLHLVLAGRPHDPSNGWAECTGPIVDRFLEAGIDGVGDTSCVGTLDTVPFMGPDDPLPFE